MTQLALDFAAERHHGCCTVWFSRGNEIKAMVMDRAGTWHDGAGPTFSAAIVAALEKGAPDPEFRKTLDELSQ